MPEAKSGSARRRNGRGQRFWKQESSHAPARRPRCRAPSTRSSSTHAPTVTSAAYLAEVERVSRSHEISRSIPPPWAFRMRYPHWWKGCASCSRSKHLARKTSAAPGDAFQEPGPVSGRRSPNERLDKACPADSPGPRECLVAGGKERSYLYGRYHIEDPLYAREHVDDCWMWRAASQTLRPAQGGMSV